MWTQIGRAAMVIAASVVAAALLVLPAAGQVRVPPQHDGSTLSGRERRR